MNTCNHTNFKPSEAEKEQKRLQRFAQTAVVPKGNDRHFVIALLEQGAEGVETPLPIEGLTIQRVRLTPDNGNDPIEVKHKLYTPETLGVELTKAHQEALGLGGYTLTLEGRIPDANFEDGFRDFTLTKPLCRVVNPEDYAPEASAPNNPLRLILSELVKGEKGEKGDAGERGEKGEQGLQGERGEKGEDGKGGDVADFDEKLDKAIANSIEVKKLNDFMRVQKVKSDIIDIYNLPHSDQDKAERIQDLFSMLRLDFEKMERFLSNVREVADEPSDLKDPDLYSYFVDDLDEFEEKLQEAKTVYNRTRSRLSGGLLKLWRTNEEVINEYLPTEKALIESYSYIRGFLKEYLLGMTLGTLDTRMPNNF